MGINYLHRSWLIFNILNPWFIQMLFILWKIQIDLFNVSNIFFNWKSLSSSSPISENNEITEITHIQKIPDELEMILFNTFTKLEKSSRFSIFAFSSFFLYSKSVLQLYSYTGEHLTYHHAVLGSTRNEWVFETKKMLHIHIPLCYHIFLYYCFLFLRKVINRTNNRNTHIKEEWSARKFSIKKNKSQWMVNSVQCIIICLKMEKVKKCRMTPYAKNIL